MYVGSFFFFYVPSSLSIYSNIYLHLLQVQGFGFNTADKIAQKEGISLDSEFRLASGILHTLSVGATADGHCCLNKDALIDKTTDLLVKSGKENFPMRSNATEDEVVSLQREDIESVVSAMLGKNQLRQLVVGDDNVAPSSEDTLRGSLIYHPKMYAMEKSLAEKIVACSSSTAREMASFATPPQRRKQYPSNLSAEQVEAIKMACDVTKSGSLLSVVTGGPGTGKTYVMREIVNTWQNDLNLNVILASPTARAAQRLGKAAGDAYKGEAKTIHRLLDYNRRINAFLKNKNNPLEYDAIVVDEASMLDVHLVSVMLSPNVLMLPLYACQTSLRCRYPPSAS